jgi:hypothetical protein
MRVTTAARDNRNQKEERPMNRIRRFCSKAFLAAVCCGVAAAVAAPIAQADFGVSEFGASTSLNGEPVRQAGAHPDLTTHIVFPKLESGEPDGNAKNISVDLPVGLTGNPTVVPACPPFLLVVDGGLNECPPATQIGEVSLRFGESVGPGVPLYNISHSDDVPGLFAFVVLGVPVFIQPTVRPGDHGISAMSTRISQSVPLYSVDVTIWGVPFDHGTGVKERLPFNTNPTSCSTVPSTFTGSADSWQNPGVFHTLSANMDLDGSPFLWEGCDRNAFEPSLVAQPGTHRAASPTGLDVRIQVPQNEGADGIATAHVRRVAVAFPRGVTVSTSAVAGLGACSLVQIGLQDNAAPSCPDSSKLGNVTIQTQLLEEPIAGDVFLAKQKENPFNSTFAIYLVAHGPGFYLKIPGKLDVDKQTGQLTTVFEDTPQLPFEEVHLDFRGGPTAPLVTPDTCGTYRTHVEITSWASPHPVSFDNPMVIDENCSGGGSFKPTLQAGVASPVAGGISPLTIRIRRQDGEQNISRLDVTLPEGELAKLKGVEVCPDALAATGNCGKGSQVGISTTAIGTGAFPLFVPQPGKDPTALYLAGPYKGAPYSLITKVPAQSGPFDFGVIVVRTAINVDPVTTQVIAKTDPLPQILEGVPISYRDVRIEVQKPDFTVNPTSCEQRFVTTTISSIDGATAHPSAPFKVGDCASLDFAPKLAFKVKGGTNRGDYQALTATLTTHKHEANISRVAVTLPHSEFLAQEHIRTICTRVQFADKNCPDGSIYGFAKATTPLLDKPLEGPVYLRSSSNPLPDLVATLNGQFDIELAGRIDSVNGGIRNTFEVVPDAPVSRFVLKMKGGEKSLLVNSRNLCKSTSKAEVKMTGQNGKRASSRPVVRNSCGKKAARAKHRRS